MPIQGDANDAGRDRETAYDCLHSLRYLCNQHASPIIDDLYANDIICWPCGIAFGSFLSPEVRLTRAHQ